MDFEEIMKRKPLFYTDYPNSSKLYFRLKRIQYALRRMGLLHK